STARRDGGTRCSPAASASCSSDRATAVAEIEDHGATVREGAAVVAPQMCLQIGVVLEPPERRPPEDGELRACASHSLELVYGGGVLRRRSPVHAVAFDEGERPPASQRLGAHVR